MGWDGVAVKLPVGTVQGIYHQPPCLTNYRLTKRLLNGCATTRASIIAFSGDRFC